MSTRVTTVDSAPWEEPSLSQKVEVRSQERMPKGIPYIVGNEMAERFSYYGMKTILVVFMTKYLLDSGGNPAVMSEAQAKVWFHVFGMGVYFFPILGALVSDIFWGKYKTIMRVSIVYCLGHLALALFETRFGLALGLTLIAIGSGGIKPVVSAHVGDQFTAKNSRLLDKVFSYFYFSINLGAFVSSLLTPLLLHHFGPSVAFGVPGVLMFLATVVFWMGRKVFIAIPPVGWQQYKQDLFSPQGKKALLNLSLIYVFISVFWALFDQSGSSWILQADKMDRMVDLRFWLFDFSWLRFELLPSQIYAANPIMVLAFIPIFTYGVYPLMGRFFEVTPLHKITIGMFVAVISFVLIAQAESLIQQGYRTSVLWQLWAYVFLTAAEIMVSITALEFSYTQAPNSMKSIIMGLYLLSISLGNGITAVVNFFIEDAHGTSRLEGAAYYWFFTILMVAAAVLFAVVARFYREEKYIQDHSSVS